MDEDAAFEVRRAERNAMIAAAQAKEEEMKAKGYPKHWGNPPRAQTKDRRELPGGYGMGSGTLSKWIQNHLDIDEANAEIAELEKEPNTPKLVPNKNEGRKKKLMD